jgi:type II secretory pathway pseudopilin PulG
MRGIVNKGGQVWVETVIYTLIGLTIMGLVLAVALPKINAKKDEVLINQAIQAMGDIDNKVYLVQGAALNRRTVDLDIGKGKVIIDVGENTISWVIDSRFKYSEPGFPSTMGNMIILTEETDPWTVTMTIHYAVDIRFGEDMVTGTKELGSAPTPYKLMVENAGNDPVTGNLIVKLSVS